ncbi:MAG TPA: hypothetical protein VFO38_01235 [Candidatus Saccharimonadales bacterium]|nr:hypothetical protein [Candidatus Saccharimonadales bacterium]
MQPEPQQQNGGQQGFYRPTQTPQYNADSADDGNLPIHAPVNPEAVVDWEASEYIHRSKSAGWIIIFGIIVAAIIAVSVLLQAWTFTALAVVMAVAFGFFAFRQPKTKHYSLSHQALKVDDTTYELSEFRAFGIVAEDAFFSIMLIPVKRFMPAITMYFGEEDGEKIVDILGAHLPLQDIDPDPIDALMRRLHF